jgi:hypothetical protein
MEFKDGGSLQPVRLTLLSQSIGIIPGDRNNMKLAVDASEKQLSPIKTILPIHGEQQSILRGMKLGVAQ